MLLNRPTLEGIAAGAITLVFRRWKRPTVSAGGTLRTRVGVLEILSVDVVAPSAITADDAHRAGYATRRALLDDLAARDGTTYRIAMLLGGEDPRIRLRESPIATAEEMDEVQAQLARLSWSLRFLEVIEVSPTVRAPDLAASIGMEIRPFKQRVRRLKELGLTESLKVGYRLSPRGESYLDRLRGPC